MVLDEISAFDDFGDGTLKEKGRGYQHGRKEGYTGEGLAADHK